MNNEFPFLLIEPNKNNQDDEPDFLEEKRKSKKFDLKKYEKFKPKISINNHKKDLNLEGAENKVKSLLSIFLKDYQEEEKKNSLVIDNNKYEKKMSQKDIIINKYKKINKKRNSAALLNLNFGHIHLNKRINSNKNVLYNINNINKQNTATALNINKNHHKKESLNKNMFKKMKNFFNNKTPDNEGSPLKNNTKNRMSYTSSNRGSGFLTIKSKLNKNKYIYDNINENDLSPGLKNKIKQRISFNSNNLDNYLFQSKKNDNNLRNSLNNNLLMSNDLRGNEEVKKRKYSNQSDFNSFEKKYFKKNNNNKYENINVNEKRESLYRIENKNIKNNVLNESRNNTSNNNNTIISEGSDCNIIKHTLEDINKNTNKKSKKDLKPSLKKKANIFNITQIKKVKKI